MIDESTESMTTYDMVFIGVVVTVIVVLWLALRR